MFAPITYTRYSYALGMEVNATSSTKVSVSFKGAFEKNTDVDAAISSSTIFRDSYKLIPYGMRSDTVTGIMVLRKA